MPTEPAVHWTILLTASSALACVLPYQVGNNASASEDEVPVCGDGIVEGAEACDDGEDEPNDGCDRECRPTPRVEWVHTDEGVELGLDPRAVAVDPAGRIVVVGNALDLGALGEPFVVVLEPDGTVAWRLTISQADNASANFNDVAVDADGRIFAAGHEIVDHAFTSVIRCYDRDGGELWHFREPGIKALADLGALAFGPAALYSLGHETQLDDSVEFVVRRHDPASGEVAWRHSHDDVALTQALDMAYSADSLVVVGNRAGQEGPVVHPYVAVLDTAGAVVSRSVDEDREGSWTHATPIGPAGDLLLTGYQRGETAQGADTWIRRVTAGGAEAARLDDDTVAEKLAGVAVADDETSVLVGLGFEVGDDKSYTYARRLAGDGTTVWTGRLQDIPGAVREQGAAVAFGPGFVVAAGTWSGQDSPAHLWVRRFSDR